MPQVKTIITTFYSILSTFQKNALQKLTKSAVCRVIEGSMEVFQILKCKENLATKEETRIFLNKIIDFGLMNFAKTDFVFKDDVLAKGSVKKSERMMNNMLMACKLVFNFTF